MEEEKKIAVITIVILLIIAISTLLVARESGLWREFWMTNIFSVMVGWGTYRLLQKKP